MANEPKPTPTPEAPPAIGDLGKQILEQKSKIEALEKSVGEMTTTQAGMAEKYKMLDEIQQMIKPFMDQMATGKLKTGNPLIDGMLGPIFADMKKLKGQQSKVKIVEKPNA